MSDYTFAGVRRSDDFSRVIRYRIRASVADPYQSGLLAGDTVSLTVTWGVSQIQKSLAIDTPTGEIAVALTDTETGGLPLGAIADYRVRLTRGTFTKTLLSGKLDVSA